MTVYIIATRLMLSIDWWMWTSCSPLVAKTLYMYKNQKTELHVTNTTLFHEY